MGIPSKHAKCLICAVFIGALTGCITVPDRTKANDAIAPGNLRDQILETAKSYIGVPYLFGGKSKKGVDCVGLVNCVLRSLLPGRSWLGIPEYLKYTRVKLNAMKPGDFVFFNPYGKGIGHIGIFIGNNRFIHAPGLKQYVRIDTFDAYWGRVLVASTRLYQDESEYAHYEPR
jgi:cell wall-associated NlpC family hydrolase